MEREKVRKTATRKTMLRIAGLKIKAYGLKDTPEEYIEKCQQKTTRT